MLCISALTIFKGVAKLLFISKEDEDKQVNIVKKMYLYIEVNFVIARIVTARIGYSTISSWTPKFHTPLPGFLPENRVIKASCYSYTIY